MEEPESFGAIRHLAEDDDNAARIVAYVDWLARQASSVGAREVRAAAMREAAHLSLAESDAVRRNADDKVSAMWQRCLRHRAALADLARAFVSDVPLTEAARARDAAVALLAEDSGRARDERMDGT